MTSLFRLNGVLLTLIFAVSLPHLSIAATTPAITAPGVLAFTNAERIKVGLPALTSNVALSTIATRKMTDLFARQYFAHEAPTGEDVSDLAKDAGYEYLTVGENLAMGDFSSSQDVVTAWMNSAGHKKNILSKAYSEIGIAAGRSKYEGRTVWIVVQSFGLPRSACPLADPLLRKKIGAFNKKLTILQTIATMREKTYKASDKRGADLQTLVDAYNLSAKLYNKQAAEYRPLVTTYNKQIEVSNTCIKKKTKK